MSKLIKVEIGEKYGRLKVLKLEKSHNGYKYYLCMCDCGTEKIIRGDHLTKGESKSCGCLLKEVLMAKGEDLTGLRFGRLFVKSFSKRDSVENRAMWECECDCGETVVVRGKDLKSGHTKSCGCFRLDLVRKELGEAAFNDLYSSYKRGAEKRDLIFELSESEFRLLTSSNCFYCNKEPSQSRRKSKKRMNGLYIYNGIDRVNNEVGYTLENCVPCCKKCNQGKSDMKFDEFLNWISIVYNTMIEKGVI